MKKLIVLGSFVLAACAQPPWPGVVVTNAPASLGNCMPEKPTGGCP